MNGRHRGDFYEMCAEAVESGRDGFTLTRHRVEPAQAARELYVRRPWPFLIAGSVLGVLIGAAL